MSKDCEMQAVGDQQTFMIGDSGCREVQRHDLPIGKPHNERMWGGAVICAGRDNGAGQYVCTARVSILEHEGDDASGKECGTVLAEYAPDADYAMVFEGLWNLRTGSVVLRAAGESLERIPRESFEQTSIRPGVYLAVVAVLDAEKTRLRHVHRSLSRTQYLVAFWLHGVIAASWITVITGVPGVLLLGLGSGRFAAALDLLVAVGPWVAAVALLGVVAQRKLAVLRGFTHAAEAAHQIVEQAADVIVRLRRAPMRLATSSSDAAIVV